MSSSFSRHPFLLSADEVASQLGTNLEKGLTELEADSRSRQFPRNELDIGGAIPWYTIFIRQLFNAMIIVRRVPFLRPWRGN